MEKKEPAPSFADLLEGVTEENLYPEADTGPAVGKEDWQAIKKSVQVP